MKVLVLGLGNELRGDDAVGLLVAQAVRERLSGNAAIEVRASSEMGLALLDEIAGAEALVLVDSIQTGCVPPGHVHEFRGAELGGLRGRSPHVLGVGDTLALGKLLGEAMPCHVTIVAIEVGDTTEFRTGLSPAVAASLPGAIACVERAADAFVAASASESKW